MAYIDENELKRQIKSETFSKLYFLYGNEPYLKQFYFDGLIKKAVNQEFAAFNLHVYTGRETDLHEVSQCIEAMPMMDSRVCTAIKDMPVHELNQETRKELETILADIPDTAVVVFLMQNIEFDPKKDAKWRDILALFNRYGTVAELNKRKRGDIIKLLLSGVQKRGSSISRQTAEYLIDTAGDDLNTLLNEMEKLSYYARDREIEKRDVDLLCVKTMEARVFDLTKAILSKQQDKAFAILDTLFTQKNEPVLISGALISAYVDMYRAKAFVTAGRKASECAEYYNYRGKTFRLDNGARDASRLNIGQLRNCLDILDRTDRLLKNSASDKKLLLEQTVVQLILTANGEKVRIEYD